MSKNLLERVREGLRDFAQSYRRNSERFGVWWTLFTASMLTLFATFILFALILAAWYLP